MTAPTAIPFIDCDGIARVRYWPVEIPTCALGLLLDQRSEQVEPVPVQVVRSYKEAQASKVMNDADYGLRCDLKTQLSRELSRFKASHDIPHDDRMATVCFTLFVTSRLKALWIPHMGKEDSICASVGQDWMDCYLSDLFLRGYRPNMLQSFYRVMMAGLYPLVWRGSWPEGFCYAYCPPDHPWATTGVPPAWQPSAAAIRAGLKKPKPIKPVTLPVPSVPVADLNVLREAIASLPPGQALQQWLAPWAETPGCQEALAALAGRVQRLELVDKALHIHGQRWFVDEPIPIHLVALPPYAGELKPMPLSAAQLIRRHAGVYRCEPSGEQRPLVPTFARGRFPVAFDLWWTPNLWDAAEPFRKPPLAPCTDSNADSIWVYHPLRERLPGELELRRISHDFGTLHRALPYGAGGVVLRLMAELLMPDDKAPTDFGLRDDEED